MMAIEIGKGTGGNGKNKEEINPVGTGSAAAVNQFSAHPEDDEAESFTRRNRRAQRRDQVDRWRSSAGPCWPLPADKNAPSPPDYDASSRSADARVQMPTESTEKTIREAVGVFDDEQALLAAADALMVSGFDRADLSLLAGEDTITEKLGHIYQKVEEEEDDPAVPRTAFIEPESIGEAQGAAFGALTFIPAMTAIGVVVASGGALAAAIGGAAIAGGAGALLGGLAAAWIGSHHADYLQEQLDRGGLLLWVRTWNEDDEKRAVEILSRHSAHDVHIHDLPA